MPSLIFSPPSFSSTASSRTMFRNTYYGQLSPDWPSYRNWAYIVTAENSYDLAASVELDEQSLIEVLQSLLVCSCDENYTVAFGTPKHNMRPHQ